jgi:hypothetical protein
MFDKSDSTHVSDRIRSARRRRQESPGLYLDVGVRVPGLEVRSHARRALQPKGRRQVAPIDRYRVNRTCL